jgi:hypothetical protein
MKRIVNMVKQNDEPTHPVGTIVKGCDGGLWLKINDKAVSKDSGVLSAQYGEVVASYTKTIAELKEALAAANAAFQWRDMQHAPLDGTEILLCTTKGIVSAWFCSEPPSAAGSDDGRYEWVCFDDKFTLDDGDGLLGWSPLPAAPSNEKDSEHDQEA